MGVIKSKKIIYFFGQKPLKGVLNIPLIKIEFIDPKIYNFYSYNFLIITSKYSIDVMEHFGYNLKKIPLCCVGKKTALHAKNKSLIIKYISKGYSTDLAKEIKPFIEKEKGLYLRPKITANDSISDYVKQGVLDEAICYEASCIKETPRKLLQPSILLFSAPSQVNCFMKHFRFDENDIIIVLGHTTAKALPLNVTYTIATKPSLENMLATALNAQK